MKSFRPYAIAIVLFLTLLFLESCATSSCSHQRSYSSGMNRWGRH
jgi:hypothetical protein